MPKMSNHIISSFLPQKHLHFPLQIILSSILLLPLTVVTVGDHGPSSNSSSNPLSGHCPPLPHLNYRPLIGILTHPRIQGRNGSYLAASYVKFVESAGARVIPLFFDEPWSVLSSKLELVNGVLLTGGSRKDGDYFDVVRRIFEKVKEKNDAGDYFPMYAICLGFELLSKIVSGNDQILESIDAMNMGSSIQFVDGVDLDGTVYGSFPPYLRDKLGDECIVFHEHMFGISKERFESNEQLSGFFKVMTTSEDRNQKVYVSTVQAHDYPITGFQWHPEKNAFEWGLSEIPHSLHAIQVTQHTANFLVSEARKSRHEPPNDQVLDNLIYKYQTKYSGDDGKGFDQTYIFDPAPSNASLDEL